MNFPQWLCLSYWAVFLGTNEAALRLIFTIFLGYPNAIIFRKFFHTRSKFLRNFYCALTGLLLGYYNFGTQILHCVVTVLGTYLITLKIDGKLGVLCSWIWNLGYLLAGYYWTETHDYDILWTMPQCVLCLRMIGFSIDVYDTYFKEYRQRSGYSLKNSVNLFPSFTEIFGFAFFPSSFLIGPQFNYARYASFVENSFDHAFHNQLPPSVNYAIRTFLRGLFYLIVSQVGALWIPTDYLLSTDFANLSIITRLFYLGCWGRATLYKYIACWLLTEGACALYGLTYNGRDKENPDKILWNGVQNVDVTRFETCHEFTHYIQSFNCNTNTWVAEYVYKRLKDLNNKMISQIVTLIFLAIWHGFHSGYYVTFILEFIVLFFEREFYGLLKKRPYLLRALQFPLPKLICLTIKRIYTLVFMGFCLLPFVLRVYDKYSVAIANVNYVGFILFCAWPIYKPLVRLSLKHIENMVLSIWGNVLRETVEAEKPKDKSSTSSQCAAKSTKADIEHQQKLEANLDLEGSLGIRYRGDTLQQHLDRLKSELHRGILADRDQLKNELHISLDRFLSIESPSSEASYQEYWRKIFLLDQNVTEFFVPKFHLSEDEYARLEKQFTDDIQSLGVPNTRVIFKRPTSLNLPKTQSSSEALLSSERKDL